MYICSRGKKFSGLRAGASRLDAWRVHSTAVAGVL